MITLTMLATFLVIICLFYIIGIFNTKVAGQVDLVLFTLSNLRLNKKNAQEAPRKLAKLARILLYRRRLLANKIAARRLRKQATKKPVKII